MHDRDFQAQLKGFSLTTAEILYRLPDFPNILQTYVWQDYDLHPRFPKLNQFLIFWEREIDGKLFKIRVAHARLLSAREIKVRKAEFKIN